MESTEQEIKNLAFKTWMVKAFKGYVDKTADHIFDLLMDQGPMAYELMAEADAEFTQEGYKKAAEFVIKQVCENEK